jgi:hypothetical protein
MSDPPKPVDDSSELLIKLAALSNCINTLFERFAAIATSTLPDDEPAELQGLARTLEGIVETVGFFRVWDPSDATYQVTEQIFGPGIQHLSDHLTRQRSRRHDGTLANPAKYTLMESRWRAFLAASADVLIWSLPRPSHESTLRWLQVRLGAFPGGTAARAIEWRDEILQRMPLQQRPDQPLDIMATIFLRLRPARSRLDPAEAERLAVEWIEEAKRSRPV